MSDEIDLLYRTRVSLRAKVKELEASLEYLAGPMMLGDDPTLGYHQEAIDYIIAALEEKGS